jgi:hypothetical protein
LALVSDRRALATTAEAAVLGLAVWAGQGGIVGWDMNESFGSAERRHSGVKQHSLCKRPRIVAGSLLERLASGRGMIDRCGMADKFGDQLAAASSTAKSDPNMAC